MANEILVTRIQKYSSYAFLAFSSLHITNTSIIPLLTRSVSSSDSYLLLTRPYYQTLPLEPLLVTLPLLSHIVSGFLLRLHRRNQTLKRTGAAHVSVAERLRRGLKVWPEVSWASLSGYLLVPLVYGHIAVNRIIPLVVEGGSSGVGLGFVAHGFARHPVLAWTSYSALLGTAVGHMVWGVVKWMGWGPRGSERERRSRRWSINGAVAVITGVWAAGGLGVIARGGADEGWVGKGYDELYKLIPGLG